MIKHFLALSLIALTFSGCEMDKRSIHPALDQGAIEQSEKEVDRTITQQIRQSLMNNGTLSLQAKNVTITTSDGIVNLKGTVSTEEEKMSIERAAKAVSGVKNVNNLLIVQEQVDR